MVQINFAQKQVNAKVVYYGPGMSGKTTNLEIVHQRAPSNNRGDLTSISTDGDRTLFFDFMPLDLGTVAGMRTCFQIYTVPGQVYYNSTRKLVLQGVDGVVFVADSSAAMIEENLESLRNLEQNLNEYGKSLANVPHVIQFNKRDLPDAMPVEELNRLLNPHNAPFFEAVANSGQGVFPTLKALAARVLETIHNGSRSGTPQPGTPMPQAAAPAAQAPISAAKTGFYGAPTTSPAAMAAAQRALQQTGYHSAVQAQPGVPQRVGAMPPPLGQPMQVAAQAHGVPQGMHAGMQPGMQQGMQQCMQQGMQQGMGAMPLQPSIPMGGPPPGYGAQPMAQQPAPMMMQAQPPSAPMPQQGGLRMAGPQSSMASHTATATMNPQGGAPQPTSIQMMQPDVGTPVKRNPPAARPQAKPDGRPSPGPAGRAAPAPGPQVQPKKSKGLMYATIFVVVALGIGAVVAKVVLKVF